MTLRGFFAPMRPWACRSLEYLSMGIKEPFYSDYDTFRPIRLSLARSLFCQLALLTNLRVLRLTGFFTFPCDHLSTGFYQLHSLRALEEVSMNFEWNGLGWRMVLLPTNPFQTTMVLQRKGFLDRSDIEWMVEQWPRIRSLSFCVWAAEAARVGREMRQWLRELGKSHVNISTDCFEQGGRRHSESSRL